MFAEIDVGSGFHPIGALAEVNLVHVHFQDFLLGVFLLDLESDEGFVELPAQGLFLGQEVVLGQLLGNGAAALDLAPPDVGVDGTADAPEIDAAVFIETDIFRCQESVLQVLGHLVDGHRDPVFLRIYGGDQIALGIKKMGRSHGGHVLGEDLGSGEFGHGEEGGNRQETYQDQGHDR